MLCSKAEVPCYLAFPLPLGSMQRVSQGIPSLSRSNFLSPALKACFASSQVRNSLQVFTPAVAWNVKSMNPRSSSW
jgi:hypothetical protein